MGWRKTAKFFSTNSEKQKWVDKIIMYASDTGETKFTTNFPFYLSILYTLEIFGAGQVRVLNTSERQIQPNLFALREKARPSPDIVSWGKGRKLNLWKLCSQEQKLIEAMAMITGELKCLLPLSSHSSGDQNCPSK